MISIPVVAPNYVGLRFFICETWELDCWSLNPLSPKNFQVFTPLPSSFSFTTSPDPSPHHSPPVNFGGFINTGSAGCFPQWAVMLHVSAHAHVLWLFYCSWTWFTCCYCWERRHLTLKFYCLILAHSHYHTEWLEYLTGLVKGFMGEACGISPLGLGSVWFFGSTLHSPDGSHWSGPWLVMILGEGLGRKISGLCILCTAGVPWQISIRGVAQIISLWFHCNWCL